MSVSAMVSLYGAFENHIVLLICGLHGQCGSQKQAINTRGFCSFTQPILEMAQGTELSLAQLGFAFQCELKGCAYP
jgi:hypothetical protein